MIYLQESENIFRDIGQQNGLANTLSRQARLYMNLLRWEDAEGCLKQSLEHAQDTKDRYLETDNLVTLITLNYFRNTEDEIPPYQEQVNQSISKYKFDDLQGRLELTLGNIAYDQQRYEEEEIHYRSAFNYYVKACEHMLSFNTQRYEVCLATVRKRLTFLKSNEIRRAICNDLIGYWRDHNLEQKDGRLIQLAELES